MTQPKQHWQKLSQKTVYKGRVQIVSHQVRLPDGSLTTYEVDHNPLGAAACLVKLHNGRFVLANQYRFPLDQWIYDLPGGGRDHDESFEQTARRECREEVGIQPRRMIFLAHFYPIPGRSDWPIHLFFCDDYDEVTPADNGPTEIIQRCELTSAEIVDLINTSQIIDSSLLIAWYTAQARGLID